MNGGRRIRGSAPWYVWVAIALVMAAIATGTALSRISSLRETLVTTLSKRLNSDVQLGTLSVSAFPVVSITGTSLAIRHRGSSGPPQIAIDRFTVEGGLLGLLSRPPHFRTVHLDGLAITISHRGDEAAAGDTRKTGTPHIYIDRVLAHAARLTIVPKRPGKAPRIFAIHDLAIDDAGFDRAMPFSAKLTNPLPRGDIAVAGSFGPWQAGRAGATPISGRYEFRDADLSTINGIAGTLSSEGEFDGVLERIGVRGSTETPDFSVDVGGGALPLNTRFDATVDGTDGDTFLNDVKATFGATSLTARGAIVGTPGVKGRTVRLDVRMDRGRIEDVLRLAVSARAPLMTGDMRTVTRLLLPPGGGPVSDRLQLAGSFALTRGEFSDDTVQQRLVTLSRRSRGLKHQTPAGRVVSDLRGRFRMEDGILEFADLTFGVPGARVRVSGRYGLRTEALDFLGDLQMQATVSEALGGGVKGVLARPFDPLFKRGDAGALVPIKIGGTREAPTFGLAYGRVFSRR